MTGSVVLPPEPTEWKIWADIRNVEAHAGAVGTLVHTAYSFGDGGTGLLWWLDKAGLQLDTVPPWGQCWPR